MQVVNTSEQKKLIANFMASRKRAWKACVRRFPTFEPGVTTTAQYIALFAIQSDAHVPPYGRDLQKWHTPAPFHTEPEVVEETTEEFDFA